MANIVYDLSGTAGLVERYQGDLNSTSASPHLRYIGNSGQLADGIYNPLKKYGYMSPANGTFTTLSGTIADGINSIQYEAEEDVVYLSEEGQNILQLSLLSDTSVANYLTTVDSGDTIKDMLLYEVNGRKAIIYAIDSGDTAYEIDPLALSSTEPDEYFGGVGGMYVGFKMLGSTNDDLAIETNKTVFLTDVQVSTDSEENSIDNGTNYSRKLSQPFSTDLITSKTIDQVGLFLIRTSGTGAGITLKLSIQTEADRNTSPYTYRGAWVTATGYSVNDTVLKGSITFTCIRAHTSGGTTEPEVGSATEDYWQRFGAPSGTEVASATVSATILPTDDSSNLPGFSATTKANLMTLDRTWFNFNSTVLSPNTIYWLVLEESGTNMTASDVVGWGSSVNDTATYVVGTEGDSAKYYSPTTSGSGGLAAANQWLNTNVNDQGSVESRDFQFGFDRFDYWTRDLINGHFIQDTGQRTFLHLSDNGLIYWVVGNSIHTIDGSIVGGLIGNAVKNILVFPSYLNIVDITESGTRQYIAIQTSEYTNSDDDRTYGARRAGIFLWDKRSQAVGNSDFLYIPGVKEIKKIFISANGTLKIICVNNSDFTEIRGYSNGTFPLLQSLDKNAYPAHRRGLTELNNLSVWLGQNGIIYGYGSVAPGQPDALFKLGDMSVQANAGLSVGPIMVGHEYATAPRLAMLMGWTDSDPSYIVQKWYPNGEGTIDSLAQTAINGNIYTKVDYLPRLSLGRSLTIYCSPVSTTTGTTIATIKLYKNQESSPFSTKTITDTEAAKGYISIDINKPNMNAFQFEIEHSANALGGTTEFEPSIGLFEYEQTGTHTHDNG